MVLPKISLITPSYNQGHFLRQTINSVLSQGYPNLEYLILDGGSTDSTLEVLNSFGDRIKWVSEPDKGQTNALNKGFKQATGEIIGFVNSDDLLSPNALWEVAGTFLQNPNVTWITADYEIIDQDFKTKDGLVRWYKHLQRSILAVFPSLFGMVLGVNNPISQPSTFWRASIHREIGYLREDLDLVMDYEWWWRIYREYGPPKVVPFVWSVFRVHPDSKGGMFFRKRLDEQWSVAKEYGVPRAILAFHTFHNQVTSWMYANGLS